MLCFYLLIFFFFSSRRRHTRSCLVSWARRCVQETVFQLLKQGTSFKGKEVKNLQKVFSEENEAEFMEKKIRKQSKEIEDITNLQLQKFNESDSASEDNYESLVAKNNSNTVSYTHLTLPTICSVQISVVAVSLKKKKKV
eukprot:TRINITY_DN29518_c0_g1_i1.p2 TRINITY_DN29518_c0_g1~~TRINITY_DN29518_c0_g1_i1.p2  ORF type:complete len:140 (-),score=42.14 TRINITY_DN29518_c0_g1_i1:87-506(-)